MTFFSLKYIHSLINTCKFNISTTKWKFESKHNLKPVLHFDCLFVNKDNGVTTYNLFNYGTVITGKSVEDVLDNLSNIYSSSFPKDHTKVCFCLY